MGKAIYIIVRETASHIEELVNIKIREGYVPLGGVCVTYDRNYGEFHQAMILKEYAN